ncbi:DUF3961 domain-containing protein [Bacillus paralicheniformis]|uniref:DUF3961 domain-containing protein n=1 Tax=Bacillus paralicheniformis TaxID=1648923 RepID=UPI001CC62955|nr:DUF3961 domain-containing protein [Bacillus paralicheniformis]UAY71952.1 DUF3961 domain-containing protein [Bacillus paralicheniformis]
MIRTNSGVYTDTRYQEILAQQQELERLSNRSVVEKVSDYFGLVTVSDKVWFYGAHGFCLGLIMFIMVLNVL